MGVLLIEPPFDRLIGQRCEWYPIGLTSMATLLEMKGHTARVYNAEHDNRIPYVNTEVYLRNYYKYKEGLKNENNRVWHEISDIIRTFDPDIVGLSVKSVKIPSAFKIAEICKTIDKNIKVIAGGFHATVKPEDLIRSHNIDIVVRGEGEESLLEIVESVNNGKSGDLKQIPGITLKDSEGKVFTTPDRPLIRNLNTLPYPKRELILGYEDYTEEQLCSIMTSRGCPYDCAFCNSNAIWMRKVRFVEIPNVMKEIDYLREKFKLTNFNFVDDSFTVNKKRMYEFCNILLQEKKNITWSCLTRVDLLDEDLISIMRKAGCTKIDIGIESGSERIQQTLNKGIELDEVRYISKILRKHKIFWAGFFMMGLPSETKEDILKTLAFMKEVKPNWACLSIFTPYPGSALYDIMRDGGMVVEDSENTFSHQSPENHFSKDISVEEFKEITQFMFREFNEYNNSISNLLQRALSRNYHRNPKLMIRDAKKVYSFLSKNR